jgi:hypothetical protein
MATATPTFPILSFPPEIRNLIWKEVHVCDNPVAVHHYFRMNCKGVTSSVTGKVDWQMQRAYACVDPFHKTINLNFFKTEADPDFIGLHESMGLHHHKIRLPDPICGSADTMTHATRFSATEYEDEPTNVSNPHVYVNWNRDVFYFTNEYSYLEHVSPSMVPWLLRKMKS